MFKEEEEEIKYIPINFIENPYYDDHFDLPTDKLRLGKTLVMLTKGQSDLMGNSYQLLGWGLYEKYDKGLAFLKEVVEKGEKDSLAQELVSRQSYYHLYYH
jgi:small subunit ribosomal protein S27